jgi:iron complex outermembrane receptor protein
MVPVLTMRRAFAAGLAVAASAAADAESSSPANGALPSVIVTAPRFAQDATELPYGVSVLTADQIRAAGVSTVNEAVMKLLGVVGRLDFYGGGDYGLDLRGFGGTADTNQVVIVDGIRVSEADLGGTRLAGIPIESVERIEIIHGSATLLYGEGATGGAIVITTQGGGRSAARRNAADLYGAVGTYKVREARASGTVVAGDFALDAAANRRDADNHRENFRSRVEGGSISGQWRHDGLRAALRHEVDRLSTGLPGALTTAQYESDPSQTTTPNDSARIRNARSSLLAEGTFGAWQLGVDAGWRSKVLRSINSGYPYDYDIDARTVAVRSRLELAAGPLRHSLVAGVDHGEWRRDVLGAFGSISNQRTDAVYLKDEVVLGGGTRLSAGWRGEHVRNTIDMAARGVDDHLHAWEVGAVQPVGGGVAVFGRYGTGFRVANVDEIGFTVADQTLRPQTSRDVELGARWSHPGGRAELRLYRNALTDEIGFDPNAPGPFGPGANVNFDPTRRRGLEFEVTQGLTAGLELRFNAALRRATFTSGPYEGRDVPLAARRSLSIRGAWTPAPGHRLDAGVHYVGRQNPDFENRCRMPAYATADLRYAYQWNSAELTFGVDNLADARYYTLAYACVNGAVSSIYPEAGRAVTGSVRLHF